MDGIITREEFDNCCSQIIELSAKFKDNFQSFENKFDPSQKYLVIYSRKAIKVDLYQHFDGISDCDVIDDVVDHQTASVNLDYKIWNLEHHIVYSDSYNVPIIYFTASSQDGNMISLEEIWNNVPAIHQNALQDKWSFITQQEHPYLHRPFYQLHPCHTAALMQSFGSRKLPNYVLTWLSAIGSVVNLDMRIDYFVES